MKTLNKLFTRNSTTISFMGIMCVALLISSCGGGVVKKEKANDWVEMGLKGQVKKMIEKSPKFSISQFYAFNEKGYFTEKGQISSWPTSKTVITEQYEYAPDGSLSAVSFFNNMSGALQTKRIYKDGLLTEEQTYASSYPTSELSSTKYYAYDQDGLLTKSWMNQDEQNCAEYECDKAGNILKMNGYSNGEVTETHKTVYEYDKHGNITRQEVYYSERKDDPRDKDGGIDYVEESKYDDNSRLLEHSNITYHFNSGKKENEIRQKSTTTYKYDEQDNVIEKSCVVYGYKDGKEQEPGSPAITTYIYTYDKHGNWTSRETQYNGKKQEMASRTYTYYGEAEPKFTTEDLVGAWDYYSEPTNKIEMVFKRDGTLIDYINFHSTGTYKINPEGTVITMQFTYDDGQESQTSKPMDFQIQEYTGDRLKLKLKETILYYDRKEKSENYDGEY